MVGTVDLAVIGLSTLCAVGSTITYLWFERKQRRQLQSNGTKEEHDVTLARARKQVNEQVEQAEADMQRVIEQHKAAYERAVRQHELAEQQHREAFDALEREMVYPLELGVVSLGDEQTPTVRVSDVMVPGESFILDALEQHMIDSEDPVVEFGASESGEPRGIFIDTTILPEGNRIYGRTGVWLARKQGDEEGPSNITAHIGNIIQGKCLRDREPA